MTKRELVNLILEHQGWEVKSKKNTSPELCECFICSKEFYPDVRFRDIEGNFGDIHMCENCIDNALNCILDEIKEMKYYE